MTESSKFRRNRPVPDLSDRQLEKLAETAKVRETTEVAPTPGELRQAAEKAFTLTLPAEVAETIDRLRKSPVRLSRRQWIRMAIQEKIERSGRG